MKIENTNLQIIDIRKEARSEKKRLFVSRYLDIILSDDYGHKRVKEIKAQVLGKENCIKIPTQEI